MRRPTTMTKAATSCLLLLMLAGCTTPAPTPGGVASPGKELHLYVSNQSFDQPRADIRIEVDGIMVFDGVAEVRDQHNWMLREADLEPGKHTVTAWERTTDTRGQHEFTLPAGAERWVVVDYWTGLEGKGPHFTISVHEQQVAFD